MDETPDVQEQGPSPADYHHGAELLADVFEKHLKRQVVQVEFRGPEVIFKIHDREVVFLVDKAITAPEAVALIEKYVGLKVVLQVSDVRVS